jgi:hypothetical protein
MAEEIHYITAARARPEQVQRVREWFQELEEVLDADKDYHEVGHWLLSTYPRVDNEWERILFGYETIVENACDPTLSYLDFKPEIKAAMRQVVVLNRLLHIIVRLIDYYNRNVLNFQREKLEDYIRDLTEAIAEGGAHA